MKLFKQLLEIENDDVVYAGAHIGYVNKDSLVALVYVDAYDDYDGEQIAAPIGFCNDNDETPKTDMECVEAWLVLNGHTLVDRNQIDLF